MKSKELIVWCCIVIVPILFFYLFQHTGKFKYMSYGTDIRTATLVDSYFISPFGSTIDIPDGELAYERYEGGIYEIHGKYLQRAEYYFSGLIKDGIYPLITILVFSVIYLFTFKISIKFT